MLRYTVTVASYLAINSIAGAEERDLAPLVAVAESRLLPIACTSSPCCTFSRPILRWALRQR
jgi:hypothetical protein